MFWTTRLLATCSRASVEGACNSGRGVVVVGKDLWVPTIRFAFDRGGAALA
jgi:hypothetical protein